MDEESKRLPLPTNQLPSSILPRLLRALIRQADLPPIQNPRPLQKNKRNQTAKKQRHRLPIDHQPGRRPILLRPVKNDHHRRQHIGGSIFQTQIC